MFLRMAASTFSVIVIFSFNNLLRIFKVSFEYLAQYVCLFFKISSLILRRFYRFLGRYWTKLLPDDIPMSFFFSNSSNPSFNSEKSNTDLRKTSLKCFSIGDRNSDIWYYSSGFLISSNLILFFSFQKFFMLN